MQVREQFPIQLFMEGSSGVTLELELARFARSHIQGLAQDAEEDVLVQAARKFIAEHHGSILWVVDDVADADGIAKLLPAHQSTGQPVAHVLLTGHRERWPDTMQLTGRHKIDLLSTEESMQLLRGGKGLKKEVVEDAEVMQRIEQYVSEQLGNLAISVAMLGQALQGLDAASVESSMQRFEENIVESIQEGRVERNLRGLQGTVSVLVHRAKEACGSDLDLQQVAGRRKATPMHTALAE